MIQNELISYARVGAALVVGSLLSWAAQSLHLVVSPHTKDGLVTLATGIVCFAYYLAVRALERKWPQLGILLGVPAKPTYPQIGKAAAKDAGAADVVTLLLVVILIVTLILLFHGRIT